MTIRNHPHHVPGNTTHDQSRTTDDLNETILKELDRHHLPDHTTVRFISSKPRMPVPLPERLRRSVSDHARNHAIQDNTHRLVYNTQRRYVGASRDPKKDATTVGLQHQYAGTVGRIETAIAKRRARSISSLCRSRHFPVFGVTYKE
jgi:SRSO17 transposase